MYLDVMKSNDVPNNNDIFWLYLIIIKSMNVPNNNDMYGYT